MSLQISGNFKAALRDFLVNQYDPESLQRVVAAMPRGNDSIRPHLTYPGSRYSLSVEIVDLSLEDGQLGDLKNVLLEQRSELRELVEQIWSLPIPQVAGSAVLPGRTLRPALPEPPEYLEERPEYVTIRAALRSRRALIGITGLPGSGKTTAAVASLDQDTRAGFAAVCWLDSEANMLIQAQDVRRRLARQLGAPDAKDISREELAGLALNAVREGHLLVVLDELRGRLDQLADAARCHPRTSLLITSTDSSPLISIGARDPIHLAGLPQDVGLRVLARWAGMDVATLPTAARNLAEVIGFHAEGLRILGANVAGASDTSAEWSYLEEQLSNRAMSAQALPGIPETNLAALVDQIVDSLPQDLRAMIQILAVPAPGSLIDLPLLATLSGIPAERCRRMGDDLVRRSLALSSSGKYGLAALVHVRTREQRGFDAQYRETLGRLSPAQPAVIWSIVMGDQRMALRLVDESTAASLAESTPERASPLHQAAFYGLTEVVDAILARGVDPGTLDHAGSDALHYAAHTGQTRVVRRLLASGISPFRPNDGGKDAVFIALYYGHYSTAETLLEGGAVPARETDLASDLQRAVHGGAVRVVRRLLALGAPHDPDLGPKNTPILAYAVSCNFPDIAQLLLQHGGASFRAQSLSEALFFSAQNNHIALLQPLIAARADLEWKDDKGRTALDQAAVQGHAEVVRELLLAGSSFARADGEWTPVHLAAAFHNADVITILHAAGADLDKEGPGGLRPLGLCVVRAGPGASMKSSMSSNERGLSISSVVVVTDVDPRAVQTVRMLLAGGADVNATDAKGRSALHHAAEVIQPALANELLAQGARRDLRDASGKTPLDIARESAKQDAPPFFLLQPHAVLKLLEG